MLLVLQLQAPYQIPLHVMQRQQEDVLLWVDGKEMGAKSRNLLQRKWLL